MARRVYIFLIRPGKLEINIFNIKLKPMKIMLLFFMSFHYYLENKTLYIRNTC